MVSHQAITMATTTQECEEQDLLEYVKRPSPPPFLLKTYMLVDDQATDNTISWNSDGTAFIVWQPAEFSRDLLPTLFKHCNFSSFIRQLNTYGFRKVVTSRWEFCNDMFRRGERELLSNIRRRRAWERKLFLRNSAPPQEVEDGGSSSTSSSSGHSNLLDENKRLKRENWVLSSELKSMKKKCMELVDLVESVKSSGMIDCKVEGEDERPKLFGVRLEVGGEKKRREAEDIISDKVHVLLSQTQSWK